MKDIRAVVFDMDGLLLDTEAIAWRVFQEACRTIGFDPDFTIYRRCIGTTLERTREILSEGYGPGFDYQTVSRIWADGFIEQVENHEIPKKEGVISLLGYLRGRSLKRAIVTSTRYETALKMLRNAALIDYFDFVIGGDQVSHGKPDPEIYLAACRRFNEPPFVCLALEDSENGVRSALAAGLNVIQVPDLVPPSAELKSLGHLILPSLNAVETLLRAYKSN